MPPILNNVYIGVDPGISGGIAMLSGGNLTVVPMPNTERDILDTLGAYGSRCTITAVVEHVHAMPLNGSISAFKLGMNYGLVRMALASVGAKYEAVSAQRWQKELSIPKRDKKENRTTFKNRLKAKAQELFPDQKVTLATADALLLLEYCLRIHRKEK